MVNMERFTVEATETGKYRVVDSENGKSLRFGYNNPPLYGNTEWNNFYSARGFAQKMNAKFARGATAA
jgi:hypothetical protein